MSIASAAPMTREEQIAAIRSQCRAEIGRKPATRPGYVVVSQCTLPKGHDGEHGKAVAK